MVIITIEDIIGIIFGILIIVSFAIFIFYSIINNWINKHFKKNCFDCKNYYLKDVAGAGDRCWYSCRKNKNIIDTHSMNDSYKYRKCKDFIGGLDD